MGALWLIDGAAWLIATVAGVAVASVERRGWLSPSAPSSTDVHDRQADAKNAPGSHESHNTTSASPSDPLRTAMTVRPLTWSIGNPDNFLREAKTMMELARKGVAEAETDMTSAERLRERCSRLDQSFDDLTEKLRCVDEQLSHCECDDAEDVKALRVEKVAIELQRAALADETAVAARVADAMLARTKETRARMSVLEEQAKSIKRAADVRRDLVSPTTAVRRRLREKVAGRPKPEASMEPAAHERGGRDASLGSKARKKVSKARRRHAPRAERSPHSPTSTFMCEGDVSASPEDAPTVAEATIPRPEPPPSSPSSQHLTVTPAARLDFRSALLHTPVAALDPAPLEPASEDEILPAALVRRDASRASLRMCGLELRWAEPTDVGQPSPRARATPPDWEVAGLADVHRLVSEWLGARRSKDWVVADRLRARLRRAGVDLDPMENYIRSGLAL